MAEVTTELLDKLYKKTQELDTEFFMRILEDPDYFPETVDQLRNDIEAELKQCEADADALLDLL